MNLLCSFSVMMDINRRAQIFLVWKSSINISDQKGNLSSYTFAEDETGHPLQQNSVCGSFTSLIL